MNRQIWRQLVVIVVAVAMNAAFGAPRAWGAEGYRSAQSQETSAQMKKGVSPGNRALRTQMLLVEEVRHQLAMLPWYNVFDWLEGEVTPDGTVTLRGQVVLPVTKSDAGTAVRHIEGVQQVKNEIEVLPPSPVDERIRMAVYRAIFRYDSPLFQYAIRSVPPIHIIVKNGNVTLRGVVATNMDSQLAYTAAREVPGTFTVTNDLRVEEKVKKG